MQKSKSVVVDDLRIGPKLPDMKTAYSRCCRSVLWATSGVHLLAPPPPPLVRKPRKEIFTLTFPAETLTLASDLISSVDSVFTLYATSISIINRHCCDDLNFP